MVSICSNCVTFIDTATNAVKHVSSLGRSPHEAFFNPSGREVWVAVLDGTSFAEKTRIKLANGPGMTIFSPEGKYGYVCSSFTPETAVVSVAEHKVVGRVKQESPFCPNIAATPEGDRGLAHPQGRRQRDGLRREASVQRAQAPRDWADYEHVNIVRNAKGRFAVEATAAVLAGPASTGTAGRSVRLRRGDEDARTQAIEPARSTSCRSRSATTRC